MRIAGESGCPRMRKRWIAVVLALLLLTAAAGGLAAEPLYVHYIDVGQGEAALLQGPDFTILIDAGDLGKADVLDYLIELGIERIDLFVITHPHADHIGQAAQVMRGFAVREVWMSGYEHYTGTFEDLLDAVLESDADYFEPRTGYERRFGDLHLQVLNPTELSSYMHDTCIVLRAVYGDVAFLFTGDAEKSTEAAMVQQGLNLQAIVLQLGHHGSRTSSSLGFLLAVEPKIAVYSAGWQNEYGHPHPEVLTRLRALGIPVFGTDQFGSLVVRTDGRTYELEASKAGQFPAGWACDDLNTASFEQLQMIIHIGPERAQQIMEARAVRPFDSVDELRTRVDGIGDRRLAEIKAQGLACVKGVTDD